MRKIIDLSIAIENDLPSDPPYMIPKVEHRKHEDTVDEMLSFFPGATKDDLPNGLGWQNDFVSLSVHSGTHLEAPIHYHPTIDNGTKSWAIEETPLDWCFGNGVVIDMTDKPNGYRVTSEDFKEKLNKMNYTLQKGDIVLINTGASKKWGTQEYLTSGCGMGKEATLWLLNQDINVVGTDAWSWDRPLSLIAEEFQKTHDKNIIWEGHFAGIEKKYCHMEKLTNLDQLPVHGFQVICLPIKVKGASAGWTRAVAIVD